MKVKVSYTPELDLSWKPDPSGSFGSPCPPLPLLRFPQLLLVLGDRKQLEQDAGPQVERKDVSVRSLLRKVKEGLSSQSAFGL